jgi:hypothetical protein
LGDVPRYFDFDMELFSNWPGNIVGSSAFAFSGTQIRADRGENDSQPNRIFFQFEFSLSVKFFRPVEARFFRADFAQNKRPLSFNKFFQGIRRLQKDPNPVFWI